MTEPGPLVQAVLVPLAERQGLDELPALGEVFSPSEGTEMAGYHFVSCGASLLLGHAERRYFPAFGRRARRRGAKWVAESFGQEGGQRAVIFLAHALGVFLLNEFAHGGWA